MGRGVSNKVNNRVRNITAIDVNRYSGYAKEIAQETIEYSDPDEDGWFGYSNNRGDAFAVLDGDTLVGIGSTGGGAGTELLIQILQRQKYNGHGINWLADNKKAIDYYKKFGLDKFGSGKESILYNIPNNKLDEAIKLLQRKKNRM